MRGIRRPSRPIITPKDAPPHLGVTENAAFAIAYDRELGNRIRRMARRRDPAVAFGKPLSEGGDGAQRCLKSLDLGQGSGNAPGATAFDAFRRKKSHAPNGSDPKGTPKGDGEISGANTKGVTTPWVPKQKGKCSKKRGTSSDTG